MYYSYKTKKRNVKAYRLLLLSVIIISGIFLGYRYKSYIFFWRYNYNKISGKLEAASSITDRDKRRLLLKDIAGICDDYSNENNVSQDAFFISGRAHFELGESYLDNNFSELFITDSLYPVNENAKTEFMLAIKYILKGIALFRSDELNIESRLILLKSAFYTDYYDRDELYNIINTDKETGIDKNEENARLFSIIYIQNGDEDRGLSILNQYGNVTDSITGRLFLAKANQIARRYTEAIIEYKYVLTGSTDNNIAKLANINLGKIYFNQSLYEESLAHFYSALKIDERDNLSKIWVGKNYFAMGEKKKAKAIWAEVLSSDSSNEEAKSLLGLM